MGVFLWYKKVGSLYGGHMELKLWCFVCCSMETCEVKEITITSEKLVFDFLCHSCKRTQTILYKKEEAPK